MVAVASLAGGMETGAIAQGGRTAAEEDAEAEQVAERLAYGWPDVDDEPTNPRLAGRFAKSFPLLYPMGVADMHDERDVKVSPHEYVQHMMRLPWTWETSQGPRLLWALVNTVLLHEARGKGFAVYKAALLRHGWRLSSRQVLTRGQLRQFMDDNDARRGVIGQVSTHGREVRGTAAHFAHEGKKLTAAVKHLSWRQPWLLP